MVAIRHIGIQNFRGFREISTPLRSHAVFVGEPGAGRSDLLEAVVRTLDPYWLGGNRGTDLDLHGLDRTAAATVEITLGGLTEDIRSALFTHLEFWDTFDEAVVTTLPAGSPPEGERHEWIVRVAYRLAIEDGQASETIYYPKSSDPSAGMFDRVRTSERSLIPFFWQRGLSTRPLDLAGRGELRNLIDRQTGEDFAEAVDRFMTEVSDAAEDFSGQERVASALEAVLEPLRAVRRFDDAQVASELIRFLPDGGAPSGLLRSLAAAITLVDSPPYLPAVRQGATLLAALRGGVLHAASSAADGAIVAVDDFGGEFDPFLARHLAGVLRRSSGQLLVATHSPGVAASFLSEEIVRLHRVDGERRVACGRRPANRQERISARYQTALLVEALNASAVVVVEGHHDRMAYGALAERAVSSGQVQSLDAAGICFAEADGDGECAKVARAARQLGIFTVVLLDNDDGSDAENDVEVQACLEAADAVVRLPPRMALEDVLLADVPEGSLQRILTELNVAFGDLALPNAWEAFRGTELRRLFGRTLKRPGSIHTAYVWSLAPEELPRIAIDAIQAVRSAAVRRHQGLIEL